MGRVIPLVFVVGHLTLTSGLSAQALAAGAVAPGLGGPVSRAILAAELKPAYEIHLVSDWPQLGTGGGGCVNGGQEVLDGTIELTSGGNYVGQLRRSARISFCGPHGNAANTCSLTLTSAGPVDANGEVRPVGSAWGEPVLELSWVTAPEGTELQVGGDCSPAFNQALAKLYTGVAHSLEFALPVAGEGRQRERLDEYGWIVEIR
ncbi:MAG TPA: hypothetical protein VMG41_06555 [Gemmatimonadales bacterium]|nr:hypothetical protein [Gemmatimonadales bacterium]